ncbi:unnamed protein product (macronuclear) [Paramecium tetraurelia]|uniref:Uncharacterized protein n=1 Tax=Paramecium tetraurelia TaxID=5888 RepID=A0CIX1_PARTE|nr:uncharacterized protein GSPATT00007873001 [Paramecium tetraurelia]CAK70738.1 unnamed protein product [Paramecium tetraurelia]|eukprot:XP_001438135.1 hypothetical protein (macronuclear) [Paramecium tetraurelia strain d4-2]
MNSPPPNSKSTDAQFKLGLLKVLRSNYFAEVDRMTEAHNQGLFKQESIIDEKEWLNCGKPIVDKRPVHEAKRANEKEVQDEGEEQRKQRLENLNLYLMDGVFKAGEEMGLQEWNKRRLEKSLISEQKFYYFDDDGNLVADREFFEEKIQRLFLIDFDENLALQTHQRPASRCARENQNKQLPFRLDIFIGVLQFSYHPQFSREDQYVADLKYLIKKYRKRADLALIPHYQKTLNILEKETTELQSRPDDTKMEMEMIQLEKERLREELRKEIDNLQKLMEQIYAKWDTIKEERKTVGATSSPYKLGVRFYNSTDNTKEVDFILQQIEIHKESNKDQIISKAEEARRQTIRSFRVQLEIVINNQVVAQTRKVNLDWPSFEARIMEKLQVYVFTKPTSVKLRIWKVQLINKLIDEIEIELPGEKSFAITSTGFVLKEAYFAQGRKTIRDTRYQDLISQNNKALNYKSTEEEFEGFISFRTEWPDFGPKMPPESLDMQYHQLETKYEDELGDADDIEKMIVDEKYFDINDPRNEELFEKLTKKQDKQTEVVSGECVVPYSNIKSKRQQLLKLKFVQPQLSKYKIPLLEQQIERDGELTQFLGEDDDQMDYEKELRNQNKEDQFQILGDYINDEATKQRLLSIQKTLQARKIEAKLKRAKNQSGLISIENVVNEFHFEAAASLLAECIKSIFTKRRKLGPQKRTNLDKKNPTQLSEVQISALVIQGNNVPIRSSDVSKLLEVKQKLNQYNSVKETIELLGKIKKVSPIIQVSLDIQSENVKIIRNIDVLKKKQKPQLPGQLQAFGQQEDEEYEADIERLIIGQKDDQLTSEVEGVNPEWNELIDFRIGREFKQQQFDPEDLINSRNKVTFTLFDQIGWFKQKGMNTQEHTLTITRRYIGSVTIPLLNLFQQEKMSGRFRINRPLFLLNYRTLNVENFLMDQRNQTSQQNELQNLHNNFDIIDPHIPTTIELTMTLEPSIKVNEDLSATTYFPGAESTNLFLYGIRQLNRYREQFKDRYIKFWAENLKGESVFLPRFITPLKPPEIDFTANSIEKAARYVSLIPFRNDTEVFRDLPDIYCNSQEFIDLRAGDFEEHALLLCNFFMYIDEKILKRDDIKNYVVMGRGLPEGKTQYVMRRFTKSNFVELWNPQTGEVFVFQNQEYVKTLFCFTVSKGYKNLNDVDDDACPLTNIGCIFDNQNIYINIQNTEAPSEMNFNIEDTHFWEPLLNKDQIKAFFPKGILPISNELVFDVPSVERSILVQDELDKFLKNKIKDYRFEDLGQKKAHFTTTFNNQRYAQLTEFIRDRVLFDLESFKFRIRTTGLASEYGAKKNNDQQQQDQQNHEEQEPINHESNQQWTYQKSLDYLKKLQEMLIRQQEKHVRGSKEMYGFPLNFSFVDYERAWDEIKATGIADIMSDDIEFLCITRCFPYPHYVLSTWVFIAVLYKSKPADM